MPAVGPLATSCKGGGAALLALRFKGWPLAACRAQVASVVYFLRVRVLSMLMLDIVSDLGKDEVGHP